MGLERGPDGSPAVNLPVPEFEESDAWGVGVWGMSGLSGKRCAEAAADSISL